MVPTTQPPDRPADPFELIPARPFAPAARRTLTLCGAPVELLHLPERRQRHGVPTADRPPFRPSPAARILAEETVWRGGGTALTPNRYPFASRQVVLWSEAPVREPTLAMLELGFAVARDTGGTLLINTVGAAASIPRAHLHVVGDELPHLRALPPAALPAGETLPAVGPRVEVRRLAPPYPALVLRLDGPAADLAAACFALLEQRTTPAFNLVADGGAAWLMPRSACEIPSPHFPAALGAAELWGRWCYADAAAFAAATAADLERALAIGGFPNR